MYYPSLDARMPHVLDNAVLGIDHFADYEEDGLLDDRIFEGLWRSQGGSVYRYSSGKFICIFVHSKEYKGWLNKSAVSNVRNEGGRWAGQQAFRNAITGKLSCWVEIEMEVEWDKITKYFPANIPAGHRLVYGPVEYYYRIFQGS